MTVTDLVLLTYAAKALKEIRPIRIAKAFSILKILLKQPNVLHRLNASVERTHCLFYMANIYSHIFHCEKTGKTV